MAAKTLLGDVFFASIGELSAGLRAKEYSAVELTRAFCDRLEKIGAAHNADDGARSRHWQALDAVLLHQVSDACKRRVLPDGHRIAAHHIGNLPGIALDVCPGLFLRGQRLVGHGSMT